MISLSELINILVMASILLSAIILHEYAHGWMANKLGDPTAKLAGRLTLNPLKHIDLVGTILLPGALLVLRMMGMNTFLFGWAKPVPVDFSRLQHPRRDMMLVALAGPAVNYIFAVIFVILLKMDISEAVKGICFLGIYINLLLATFNLTPIPPLDGSRVVYSLLPRSLAVQYGRLERYGILIIFGLLYFNFFDRFVYPLVLWQISMLGISMS